MSQAILIDYGCHAFTYRLASYLAELGYPIRYFANGSLESPNLTSLADWVRVRPTVVRSITCRKPYGKMSLRLRLKGELEWANSCIDTLELDIPEVVILSTVPLAVVSRIQKWAKRRRVHLIYWLQDLQGRAMYELLGRKFGWSGRVLGSLAHLWEQQILKNSHMVITIAAGHERQLPRSVLTQGRYALLENWANIEEFPEFPANNEWAIANGVGNTLNVVYAGTLGLKHDLSLFIALASSFRHRSEVRVIVVSSGQGPEELRRQAQASGLTNLVILPFQPYQDVPKVFASAAVLIAPLDASAGGFCIPSKVLSYFCAGRPTVIAINSDNPAAGIIQSIGAGAVIRPGDPKGFVTAVATFLDNIQMRQAAGRLARSYAERTFNLEKVAGRFLNILQLNGIQLRKQVTNDHQFRAKSASMADG